MNRRSFIVFSLLLLSFNLFGLTLPDGTDAMISKMEKYPSGNIKSVSLAEPTEFKTPIGALVFFAKYEKYVTYEKDTTVEFYESGKIKSGHLDKKTSINTPVGNYSIVYISFYESGAIKCFISLMEYDRAVKGRDVIITPKVTSLIKTSSGLIPVGGIVDFYENGKLKGVEFSDVSQILQEGLFKGVKIENKISFYEDGNILSLYTREPQTISIKNLGKVKFVNEITIWNNGNAKNIEFPDSQMFDTPVGLLELKQIDTYENGKFESVVILNNQIITTPNGELEAWGNTYSKNTIKFYEDGKLKSFVINNNTFQNITTAVGDTRATGLMMYYPNGQLQTCGFSYLGGEKVKTSIGSIEFNRLYFYDTGEFMGGYIKTSMNQKIDNQMLNNCYLYFDKSGQYLGIGELDGTLNILQIKVD